MLLKNSTTLYGKNMHRRMMKY